MDTSVTATSTAEDKTTAVLSYLTALGFIVALVLNSSKKTKLGAFHLRQTLGLYLTMIAAGFCQIVLVFIPILGWLAIPIMWLTLVVFWVLGLVAATQGQLKPMPVFGGLYQRLLGSTFD